MVFSSEELQKMLGGQPSLINVLRILSNHIVKFTITSTCVLDLIPGSFPQDFSPSIVPSPLSPSVSNSLLDASLYLNIQTCQLFFNKTGGGNKYK